MKAGSGIVGRVGAGMFALLAVWSLVERTAGWVTVFFLVVAGVFTLAGAAARNAELRDRGRVCPHCGQPPPKDHDPKCEECSDQGCVD